MNELTVYLCLNIPLLYEAITFVELFKPFNTNNICLSHYSRFKTYNKLAYDLTFILLKRLYLISFIFLNEYITNEFKTNALVLNVQI